MDDFYRRQRQNEDSMRRTSNPGYHNPSQDASQQSRLHQPSPLSGDPQRALADGRNIGGNTPSNYSGYYQQPAAGAYHTGTSIPSNALGYGQPTPSYGPESRPPHGFPEAYNSTPTDVMYNVSQTGAPAAVFDANQPFASRQPPALPMMPDDVSSTTYFANNPAAAAAAASMQVHSAPSGYSSGIGTTMQTSNLPSQGAASSSTGQSTAPVPHTAPQGLTAMNESYASYQRTLREVFRGIKSGTLATVVISLLKISDWLLSNVESLGLTVDNEELYESRSKLWADFNHAWLALLEKQRQIMCDKNLQRGQSLIPFEALQNMGNELIRLCDGVHKFGLVDYDIGVWEERITEGLTDCVHLYQEMQDEEQETTGTS